MILMTKNGAYMNCYNPNEIKRAKSKGWTEAPEITEVKAPVKKARKPRAKKAVKK